MRAVVEDNLWFTGPDGNFWFTEYDAASLGRITPLRVIRRFPVGDVDTAAAGRVARITTAGVVTELGSPEPGSIPEHIALGPDGAMWFTDSGYHQLGRIAGDGRITRFALPDDIAGPTGIVGRSDGRLYVALNPPGADRPHRPRRRRADPHRDAGGGHADADRRHRGLLRRLQRP